MLSETRTRQNSLANVCVKGGQGEYKKKKERRRSKKKEEEEEERMQKVERSEASTYVV